MYQRLGGFFRPLYNKIMQRRYRKYRKQGDTFTIISQNCIGTFMYHDLNLPFLSPTVNLFMCADDFIRFAENLEYYLNIDGSHMVFNSEAKEKYPVGVLDDITIHFVHYSSCQSALEAWNRRRRRINRDNMFFIMTDRDGCNAEIMQRFFKLPYPKKFFSAKEIKHPDVVYMPCFKDQAYIGGGNCLLQYLGQKIL